ncbi:hypothetical protein [Hyphomicrobium sp.]|uniref:hypothetical protein n=1 Tax=Hyphomicrobium sp. TaxID=82 RepID=UPI0025B9F18D|nr:hypothetical protein [Hyphomicrobium sp.]MCC7252737.1 hypothetical protein [Hyphomicrobium sp.]
MAQSYQSYQDTGAGEAQDAIHQLKQRAGEAAETVAQEGQKALKAAGETAEDAFAATKRFVQDQPYVAIGAVVVAACALGALWKLSSARRDSSDLLSRISDYVEPGYRAVRRRI